MFEITQNSELHLRRDTGHFYFYHFDNHSLNGIMEAQDFKIAYFNFLPPAPFSPSKEINFVSPALFNNKEVHVVLKLETGHLSICENL